MNPSFLSIPSATAAILIYFCLSKGDESFWRMGGHVGIVKEDTNHHSQAWIM